MVTVYLGGLGANAIQVAVTETDAKVICEAVNALNPRVVECRGSINGAVQAKIEINPRFVMLIAHS